MIYFVADDGLKIETSTDVPTARKLEVLREYDSLHTLIRRAGPAKYTKAFKKDLGSMTFLALSDSKGGSALDYFKDLRKNIQERSADYARFYYMFYGVSVGLVLSGLIALFFVRPAATVAIVPVFALGVLGGIVGATASIILRSSDLRITPYSHWKFLAFQGGIRAVLGALFGFIFVAAVKGEVLLNEPCISNVLF
jgi:hypothetical protein